MATLTSSNICDGAGHRSMRLFLLAALLTVAAAAHLADSDLVEGEKAQQQVHTKLAQSAVPFETEKIEPKAKTKSTRKSASYKISKSKKCTCGKNSQSRIVGGTETRKNEFPWLASVAQKMLGGKYVSIFCGATVINDKNAISAAHCFQDSTEDLYLILSHHSIKPLDSDAVWVKIEKVINHEGYDKDTHKNDIAILKFETPVNFTTKLQSACLPGNTENYDNKMSTVAGWGTTTFQGSSSETLLKADLAMITNKACAAKFRAVSKNLIDSTQMCAFTDGKDTCQGDSGGPLLVKNSAGVYHLAGVTSFGIGCSSGYPGVYTRVSKYLPWIFENTSDGTFCAGFLPGH